MIFHHTDSPSLRHLSTPRSATFPWLRPYRADTMASSTTGEPRPHPIDTEVDYSGQAGNNSPLESPNPGGHKDSGKLPLRHHSQRSRRYSPNTSNQPNGQICHRRSGTALWPTLRKQFGRYARWTRKPSSCSESWSTTRHWKPYRRAPPAKQREG